MGKQVEDANTYRVGHPLAQRVLDRCRALATPPVELRFELNRNAKKIAILEAHRGHSGWLLCSRLSIESFEAEDHILLAGVRDDGQIIDSAACKRLFDLSAEAGQPILDTPIPALDEQVEVQLRQVLEGIGQRNARWLDQEIGKLDQWSEDLKFGLEQDIKDLDKEIREMKRAASAAAALADKLTHQRALKTLQAQRNQKRRDLFVAQDQVEARRDGLIADIEGRMAQKQQLTRIFALRWRLL